MSESRLYVTSTINARPNKIDEVRTALKRLIEPSLAEPGCVSFDLVQCIEDPQVFVSFEVWQDLESHRSHLSTTHVLDGIDRAPEMLASEFKIRRYCRVE